jgi:hypothetical protein
MLPEVGQSQLIVVQPAAMAHQYRVQDLDVLLSIPTKVSPVLAPEVERLIIAKANNGSINPAFKRQGDLPFKKKSYSNEKRNPVYSLMYSLS